MASPAQSLAKVGILSFGDMGMGIAKLLVAKGYTVSTNCKGRSQSTIDRANSAKVNILSSDAELADECDIIFSVVPPRDAIETAQRIIDGLQGSSRQGANPLYFADMNAVAPSTCKKIASMFTKASAPVKFIDGSIIGGPPSLKAAPADSGATDPKPQQQQWYLPLMPTSGPDDLSAFPGLAQTINSRHISAEIGAASGLKMCFASMSKGYAAIAIQAFTTAHRLGVLGELQRAIAEVVPQNARRNEGALTGMPPKAYRWVREMEEISDTFAEEGGFGPEMFKGAADVFKAVAEDTVLGQEKIGDRKRGRTAEDVAAAMAEGMEAKKKKTE